MIQPLSAEEKQRRILLDFCNDYDLTVNQIRQIMPEATDSQIAEWTQRQELENIDIDGSRRYFRRAARNLFRINREAREYYLDKYGDDKAARTKFLAEYLPQIVNETDRRDFRFHFSLTVASDAVPDGEIIRCWLPRPVECKYQYSKSAQSMNISTHSSLYIEKRATAGIPTIFDTYFEVETRSFHLNDRHSAVDECFTSADLIEEAPHIVFTDDIKRLSAQIVGCERDKQTIARKIFCWISDNIVWAAAREYSTIDNIPSYVIRYKHGDCGQSTLLFITLCRYNGIPARWLSGFMLHPGYENIHDWCEIFLDGYGWMPVDVSFGIQRYSSDDDVRYFYFMGIDSFRIVVNRGISGVLQPEKIFPRSETVDFQRGEVEWRRGNIYFDKFDYNFYIDK